MVVPTRQNSPHITELLHPRLRVLAPGDRQLQRFIHPPRPNNADCEPFCLDVFIPVRLKIASCVGFGIVIEVRTPIGSLVADSFFWHSIVRF